MRSFLMLSALVVALLPPVRSAISDDYHNYSEETKCGVAPLNKRQNKTSSATRSTPYVLNGTAVEYGEWPFLAWIVNRDGILCSAVIVRPDLVVSAAHCFSRREALIDGYRIQIYPDYQVWVGRINLREPDKYEVAHNISQIQQGAYFNVRGLPDLPLDFVRIWLEERIKFNEYVQPICIPSHPAKVRRLATGSCFFAGIGVTRSNNSNVLVLPKYAQWIEMKPFVNMTDESKNILEFIATDGRDKQPCAGDSGGPLMALDPNGLWSLVGLHTWGHRCNLSFEGPRDSDFISMANIVDIFSKNFTVPPGDRA